MKRHPLLRRIIYGLAGLLLVLLVGIVLRPAPVAVNVADVQRGPMTVTISEEGKTRVRSRYTVSAPVSGRLLRMNLLAGDGVETGQPLAQIDPLPLEGQVQSAQARLRELQAQLAGVDTQRPKSAALQQAEARVQSAQAAQRQAEAHVARAAAALQQAERDRQRAADLHTEGAIAQQQLEAAQLLATTRIRELEAAQHDQAAATAEVLAAQEAVQLLQAEQQDPDYLVEVYLAQMASVEAELVTLADAAQRTVIAAPAPGQVLRVWEESDRYVDAGTPLLDVGDPGQLELVVDVLSTDAVRVQPGAAVQVEQWGGPEQLRATVQRVEPSAFTQVSALGVEEQRVNVIAEFDQSVPLGDGYRVDAQIVVWQQPSVLQIPVSALLRCDRPQGDGGWCVFAVDHNRAQRRSVTVGQRGTTVEILDGLEEGDRVILHPTEQIESGRRVTF
jgi:HlyD family secretion protein